MRANGLPAIVMSLLILLVGCALADENASGYPNEVLDGTDLVGIGEFQTAGRSAQVLAGTYTSETGGAVSRLIIALQNGGVNVSRSYEEPGLEPEHKRYSGLKVQPDGSYLSPDAVLKPLQDGGVLFWERQSGLEFVPDSFWIHYQPD